ncbi:MAG: von Willebrand factor [Polyangiaceae bacterium]|nr:von Willebrand factor [Polyangiaceae bacterium]
MVRKELLKALRRIQITTNRLATQQLSGNYASVFKGQGLSFREVREYQPGDDVRTIDWNVSARMGHPFVKVFVEEREMTVMLLVDLSASQRFGTQGGSKIRLATEVAALCAFSAIKHNDRVGLIMSTDQIEKIVPPKKGQKHVMRVVREIMGATPERSGTDLKVALETLMHVARRRSVAFLISDFFAPDYARSLSLAAARHDVIPVMLTDPRDTELPDVGLASFEDFETGESVIVDTHSAEVRAHYGKQMRRLQGEQVALFNKLALDHCVVRTDRPYIKPLRDLFARRARRIRR